MFRILSQPVTVKYGFSLTFSAVLRDNMSLKLVKDGRAIMTPNISIKLPLFSMPLTVFAIAVFVFAIDSQFCAGQESVAQQEQPKPVTASSWVDFKNASENVLMFHTGDRLEKDIIAGDVDRDGDVDILIARKAAYGRKGAKTNMLLINDGGKLFDRTAEHVPGFLTPDDARDIALFDANNDGWLDVIVVTTSGEQPRLFINRTMGQADESDDLDKEVWLGFEEKKNWYSPAFNPGPKFRAVAAGDVSGDGYQDLFFVDYENSLEDRLLINDGTGKFTDETLLRMTPEMAESNFGTQAIIADWNYDGVNDILKLTTDAQPQAIRLLINDPNNEGNFAAFQDLPFHETYTIEAADFNNDGRLDLYAVSDDVDYIIWNKSSNTDGTINVSLTNVESKRTDRHGGNSHAWDIDGDGLSDIGVSNADSRVAYLKNRAGKSLFDPNDDKSLAWNTMYTHDFCWVDINKDGMIDIFVATSEGYVFFLQDPPERGSRAKKDNSSKPKQ